MRRMGQQHFVSLDQAFDAGRSLIEALGESRDLVAALDLDARAQIARSKRFDATLQSLEPSREPPDDGMGSEGDHEGDYPEEGREYARAGAAPERKACHQPPTVRQRY